MNERTRRQGTRLVLLLTFGTLLISLASMIASNIQVRRLSAPLIAAIRDDNRAAVQSLLDRGASANSIEGSGEPIGLWDLWSRPDPQKSEATALMWAAQVDDPAILRLLLERGADVNARNRSGETALMWAARSGEAKAVQLLLAQGADLHATNQKGDTVLSNAAVGGNPEVLGILLDHGAQDTPPGKAGKTALMAMVQRGNLSLIQRLLDTQPDEVNLRDKSGKTALMCAVAYDPDPGTRWQDPRAPMERRALLKKQAIDARRAEMTKLLLDKGADINAMDGGGATPLMIAAAVQWPDGVQRLLQKGADVQARDKAGRTALLHAFDKMDSVGYWDLPDHAIDPTYAIVQQLLDKGADIRARDNAGQNALGLAIQCRRPYLLSYLLDRGADVSGENGVEALFEAVSGGQKDLVRRLLDRGVDVNSRGRDGRTPLLAAVCFGGQNVVPLLLARGADVSAKDRSGKTALMYASVPGPEGRPNIVPLLQQAGAKE